MNTRWLCGLCCALPAMAGAQALRSTETYPVRPIRCVVPFAPGGSSDAITRIIGPRLAEPLGQQVVLDHRAGGNGAIGTQIIAQSAPDGYTVGLAYIAAMAINPAI
jgi:tripartite-type tricarboxylate transporter receptor subunit TctC